MACIGEFDFLAKESFMTDRTIKILLAAAAAVSVFGIFGITYTKTRQSEPVSATAFKLNTVVTVTLYDSQDQDILQGALDLCDQYEKIFSRTLEGSELYRLNAGKLTEENGFYTLSKPLADLTAAGLYYGELSGGAFDISIAPVSSLWDFTSGEGTVPDSDAIKDALKRVSIQDITLDGNQLHFAQKGMELDLGALAKGYIADRIKDYLLKQGVQSAIIDLGGNVLCVGSRPDGSPFRIGLQKPFAGYSETVGSLEITGQSVVSSGIYERYFQEDGTLYHHILNPETGYPYDNGLVSVTIISEKSLDGDGLSTACFAMGLEKGMELIDRLPDIHAVFITEDGELHFSQGFEEHVAVDLKESLTLP